MSVRFNSSVRVSAAKRVWCQIFKMWTDFQQLYQFFEVGTFFFLSRSRSVNSARPFGNMAVLSSARSLGAGLLMKSGWLSPGRFPVTADRHGDGAEMLLSVWLLLIVPPPSATHLSPSPSLLLSYLYKDSWNIPSKAFHQQYSKRDHCIIEPGKERKNNDRKQEM